MRAAKALRPERKGWAYALDQFRAGLARYLNQRLRNPGTAEDLAQEVYLRLLRVANPERVRSPQAYLYRVAANTLQEFRAREESSVVTFDSERAGRLGEQMRDETAPPEEWLDRQREDGEVEKLIAQLPPMQRKVLLMATGEGLSHADIGKALGISIRTVRNHLYRALFFCRQHARADKSFWMDRS